MIEPPKPFCMNFSPTGLRGNLLQFYHSHCYLLKKQMTQGSKARTQMLFEKMMLNLKPFFSERYQGSKEGTFEGFSKGCSWVKLFWIAKMVENFYSKKGL